MVPLGLRVNSTYIVKTTSDSLEKTLMLGKIERWKRQGQQRVRWLGGITASKDMHLGKLRDMVRNREDWHAVTHEVTRGQTWLGDWKTTSKNNKGNIEFWLIERWVLTVSSGHMSKGIFMKLRDSATIFLCAISAAQPAKRPWPLTFLPQESRIPPTSPLHFGWWAILSNSLHLPFVRMSLCPCRSPLPRQEL